jgi:hypothetical protein
MSQNQSLSVRKINRIILRIEGRSSPAHRSETRTTVSHTLPNNTARQPREIPDPKIPEKRHPQRIIYEKPRTHNNVRLLRNKEVNKPTQVGSIMLPVSVNLHNNIIATAHSVFEASLNRTANAEIEGQTRDPNAQLSGNLSSAISGTVINNQHVGKGHVHLQLANRAGYAVTLVANRHNHQDSSIC